MANTEAMRPTPLVYALVAFVGLAPFVFSRHGYDVANLPQSIYVQLGAASLVLAWLLDGYRQNALRLRLPRLLWPVLGFLVWSLASLAWARSPGEGGWAWLHWCACASVLLLTVALVSDNRYAYPLLTALFVSGAGVAVIGLAQHYFGFAWIPQAVPPAATFAHKNIAAQYVVAALPLGLVAGTPLRRRGLAVAGAALMVLFVFHTLTRSAWLALAVESALAAALWRALGGRLSWPARRSLSRLVGVGLLAVSLLALANLTASGFQWKMGQASRRLAEIWQSVSWSAPQDPAEPPFTSVRHRAVIWRNTWEMVKDHPVRGVGFANHALQYPAYARARMADRIFGEERRLDFAHNDYLQVAAELGLVGVALGAWFLAALGTTLRSALGAGSADRRTAAALTLSLAGLLTDALFSFPFERALPPLSIMVLAGIAVNLGASPTRSVALSRKGTGALATLVLAGLLGLGWASWNRLAVDRHLSVMVGAEKRQDWPTILSVGQGILRLDPHQKDALLLVGAANVGMGRPQEAIGRLRALLATHPYEMNGLGNLALAYEQVGRWKEAIDCYDRVLRMVPHHARTHYNRARALEGAGRGAEAQAAYEQASELDGTVPTYAMRAGLAALRAGAYEKAVIGFRRAIEIDPNSAAAHKALGVVLFEILGRREEGRPHLERALALNPQISDAERMRALLGNPATP